MEHTKDLVSIITPSYNTARFIAATIRSVQVQTYTNWEMLIVDDCSTDGTDNVVKPYVEADARIRYLKNEMNSGAAVSRNRALREARGRWIAFLDSDDLWEPEKLERQVRFMEENGYAFSYTCYSEMDEEGKATGVSVSGPKHVTKAGMYAFCWPGCLTVMYDASVVGLVQIEDIKKNNDYAMWLKVCRKADCYLLEENLARYRRGRSGSISTHGYATLVRWHYQLWRDAEGMSVLPAACMTMVNLAFGMLKKLMFTSRKTISEPVSGGGNFDVVAALAEGLWRPTEKLVPALIPVGRY